MKVQWKDVRVKVKKGWYEHGQAGICLGKPIFVQQDWLPVLWDGEEDPDFYKLAGIEDE